MRKGHAPGIEPAVDDLRNSAINTALTWLGPSNVVDPRLVDDEVLGKSGILLPRLFEGLERRRILLEYFRHRRWRRHLPGLVVDPDIERCSPVTLPRQGPVDIVRQEIPEAAFLDVLGEPLDGAVVTDGIVDPGGGSDEPGRPGVLDEWILVGPPAKGVVVAVILTMKENATFLQIPNDLRIRILDPLAFEARDLLAERPVGADGTK